MAAADNALLDDIKLYLGITWSDEITNSQVEGYIEDGKAYIDDKLGSSGDYESPGYPRTLLKEYTRYARDAALDVFENNYRSLILAMQHNAGVTSYVASASET